MGVQLTLLQPGGQIVPTTLLLANRDLKNQRQLCILTFKVINFKAKIDIFLTFMLINILVGTLQSTEI